jgi:CPA1 family monovalent cation:H+ antiporter
VTEVPTILGLLAFVTALAVLAPRLQIPAPTFMVLGGLLISLVPGLPRVTLPPDLVFLVFLPPLLYAAAWQMPWHEFRRNLRPILLLAVGLVLATAVAVAVALKLTVPEVSWAIAFALGGILGPPDAVAATSVTRGLGVPARPTTILEGESLINDATGLVIFRVGIAAALTGTFSFGEAVGMFLVAAFGGIVIGILIGWLASIIHRFLDEATVETVLTLLTPYAAYLAAEAVHTSGVIATVSAALWVSRRQEHLFSPAMRVQAVAVWHTFEFLLTGLAFVLIGLQLPAVLAELSSERALATAVFATAIVYLAVVAVRMMWIYPAAWLPRALSRRLRARDPMPSRGVMLLIGWCGMRGVVSLAAALAIPHLTTAGEPFPYRGMLLAITFGVVLGTLVIQGLTLAPLVKWLGLNRRELSAPEQEGHARLELVAAALTYLESACEHTELHPAVTTRVREHFERQGELASGQLALSAMAPGEAEEHLRPSRELYLGALRAQRRKLKRLQESGSLDNPFVLRIQDELDRDEARFRTLLGLHHKADYRPRPE